MAGRDGYDTELSALQRGAGDLATTSGEIEDLGAQAGGAASGAAGGVLGGPLAGALSAFGERLGARSGDLGRALDAAAQAVRNCATTYQQDDAGAASRTMASAAAMDAMVPRVAALRGGMLTPSTPMPSGPPVLIPGLDAARPPEP